MNFYTKSELSFYFFQVLAYLCWLLTVLFFLIILFIWNNIRISVQVLRAAAKVIHSNYHIVLVPFFGIAFSTLSIGLFLYFLLQLLTCGHL